MTGFKTERSIVKPCSSSDAYTAQITATTPNAAQIETIPVSNPDAHEGFASLSWFCSCM